MPNYQPLTQEEREQIKQEFQEYIAKYNDYFKSSAVKTGDFENEKNDIPLNEKYLLSVYDKIKDKVDEKEFIKLLFYCRVVFDRYIIKTIILEKTFYIIISSNSFSDKICTPNF